LKRSLIVGSMDMCSLCICLWASSGPH